jgi:ectoine hydroxylase-related dioxygenase (phytanoyl-CoA dioxygenase family)
MEAAATPITPITRRPHEGNTGFEWDPVPRRGGVMSEAQLDQFDCDGYALVEGVLDAEVVAAVCDDLDDYEARVTRWLERRGGTLGISDATDITFSPHAVVRSERANAFAREEVFARLALDLVGPDIRLYWDQAVYKKPEPHREFPWHQDNGYTFVQPQHYLTCWIPLVDATVDNGAPVVAPGVHRTGTLAHHWVEPIGWQCIDEPDDAVVVEASVGDVVCLSSLTPHRTGPNRTDAVRKAYILQYAPDGARVVTIGGGDEGGEGDGAVGPCDDPDRQFLVALGGEPLSGS